MTSRIVLICALACPTAGMSASLFSGAGADRMALLEKQGEVLDRRLGVTSTRGPEAGSGIGSLWRAPVAVAPTPEVEVRLKVTPRGKQAAFYVNEAKRQARAFGIPEALFLALIQQESAWNRNALSPVGAIGLTQLMPGTAEYLRVNPHDPVENIHGGAKYLREQFDTFGNWRLALAAYNAGPGAVKKYGGVPPYRETKNYVKRILGR